MQVKNDSSALARSSSLTDLFRNNNNIFFLIIFRKTMSANDRLTRRLPHLQNLIKRDPDAYREDVNEYLKVHFN